MGPFERRLPVGAEILPGGGVHFRLWAPACKRVEAVLEEPDRGGLRAVPLRAGEDGYFAGTAPEARAGSLYRFRLDGNDALIPDPASRFQPDGLEGPSQVVDPSRFAWTDGDWPGVAIEGQVAYELHVGSFTPEGSWDAAAARLDDLKALGVTLLEVMPVATFHGRFGWGYDGVLFFAPFARYGEPDAFRRFVDRAHALGLGVILDVVYNHLGPGWDFLKRLSDDYVSRTHSTEWGETLNFDAAHSRPVRELVTANAAYWVREFHLDGLRIDATQQIFDDSPRHILAEICEAIRAAAGGRKILLIGENEPQRAELLRPGDPDAPHLDALWNEDFHHSAMVAATGRDEGYYSMHRGTPQELISAARWGWLYQGQIYPWQEKPRGTATMDLPPARFVNYIQNHDQVANTLDGRRFHLQTSPGRARALTAYFLLAPGTPMLFMGQEWGASTPFFFFADFGGDLGAAYHKGRREFLEQFRNLASPEMQALIPDPTDAALFTRSKLDWGERARPPHDEWLALHADLLRLRREDAVFRAQDAGRLHGAVLGPEAFLLRFFGEGGDDRLLLVNLGAGLLFSPPAEPLLAPPAKRRWSVIWSSEAPRYGGIGAGEPQTGQGWCLPGQAALVCAAEPAEERSVSGRPRRRPR